MKLILSFCCLTLLACGHSPVQAPKSPKSRPRKYLILKALANWIPQKTNPILHLRRTSAPGDGVVVAIANDIDDNVPQVLPSDPNAILGNHVIIDHQNGEFSFLAHFKKGSVAVSVNEKVKSGQHLGKVGNSGRSTEAHIHYHLQDAVSLDAGKGLPLMFDAIVREGEIFGGMEVVKGQVVRHPTKAERKALED